MSEAIRLAAWLTEGAWHQMRLGDVEAAGRELRRLQAENDAQAAEIASLKQTSELNAQIAIDLKNERDALQKREPVAWSVTVGTDYKNCVEITHCKSDAMAQYEAYTKGGFQSIYTLHELYDHPSVIQIVGIKRALLTAAALHALSQRGEVVFVEDDSSKAKQMLASMEEKPPTWARPGKQKAQWKQETYGRRPK